MKRMEQLSKGHSGLTAMAEAGWVGYFAEDKSECFTYSDAECEGKSDVIEGIILAFTDLPN